MIFYYFCIGAGHILSILLLAIAVCFVGGKIDDLCGFEGRAEAIARFTALAFVVVLVFLFISALGYGVHAVHFGGFNETLWGNR